MSLVLTGSEVMQVLDMDLALAAAADAFRAYGEGRVNMPPKSYLTLAQGDFRAMYGEVFLPQGHICGLKWVNVHPGNPHKGLLTVMAKVLLNDPDTGLEFADLDGTHETDFRTGAAGGLAARYLANPAASRLGLIGAGAQARTQVAAIVKVRAIKEIAVYDRHLDHAQGFAEKLAATYGVKARPVSTAPEAVTGMDIVVTTTPSTSPVVRREWVSPGTHINAIGADAAGKQELDPAILAGRQGGGGRLGPGVPLRGNQRGSGQRGDYPGDDLWFPGRDCGGQKAGPPEPGGDHGVRLHRPDHPGSGPGLRHLPEGQGTGSGGGEGFFEVSS